MFTSDHGNSVLYNQLYYVSIYYCLTYFRYICNCTLNVLLVVDVMYLKLLYDCTLHLVQMSFGNPI